MRYSVLDGWRGVCALLVALHHFHAAGHLFPLAFVRNSYLFVDFFFVLSGFVIAHAWTKRLAARREWKAFVIRRLGRLWPLHVAMLAALVAVEGAKAAAMAFAGIPADNAPFSGPTALAAIPTNLLLIHGLGLHPEATWNFPSWSISTEFYTYLVFAALCLLLPGRLSLAAAAVAGVSAGAVAALSPEYLHTITDYGFLRCLYGFFIGTLVHHLHRLTAWRAPPWPPLAEAAALVLVVAFVTAAGKGPLSMLAPLVFGAAVYVFAREAGPVSRLLATRPFQRLGEWSYSIYMVHTLVLVLIGRAANAGGHLLGTQLTTTVELEGRPAELVSLGGPWLTDLAVAAYLAVVVALSALTFKLIERPGQRLAARLTPDADSTRR